MESPATEQGQTAVCVSVIVPVYRAERYVDSAMERLLNQTLRSMEFIFVDDCGGDGSVEMIRRHAERDPRIVLLRNDCNHGPGYSRNRGIEAARGKYIAFFDIDDSCDADFYEVLYNLAEKENALICKGGCMNVYEDGSRAPSLLNNGIRKDLAGGFQLYSAFWYEHWSALYRREWVMQTGARNGAYPQGEDTFFLLQVCQGAESGFVCTDDVCYTYYRRGGSLYNNRDRGFLRHQVAHRMEKLDYLNARGLSGGSYHKYCACVLDPLADLYVPDALACGEDMQPYNEYLDGLGRFLSGIKEPERMRPYLCSAGGIAALRMLTDGKTEWPWGRRFIAALLQNADPAVSALRLPRSNSMSGRLRRASINALLAIIGFDRHARSVIWSRSGK